MSKWARSIVGHRLVGCLVPNKDRELSQASVFSQGGGGVGGALLCLLLAHDQLSAHHQLSAHPKRGRGTWQIFTISGLHLLDSGCIFFFKIEKKSEKNPSKKLDGLWIHAPFVDSDWLGWCGASCPGCPGSSDPSGWSAGWSCGPWSSGPWTRRAFGPWHPGLGGGRWAPSPNNVLQGVEPWQCKQYKVDYHFGEKMSQLFLLLINFVFVKSDGDISHPYCLLLHQRTP